MWCMNFCQSTPEQIDMQFISDKEESIVQQLLRIDQKHIIEQIPNFTQQQRESFVEQVEKLNKTYPGGLESYYQRARTLLKEAAENKNPYEGYTPNVPKGINVDFYSQGTRELEELGVRVLKDTAFVLVAGGLGERLGYNGIKVEIPIDTLTETCFLQYYISYILAYQRKSGSNRAIPLGIMTSDDTYTQTVRLLEQNDNFGMERDQIYIMKQEKVPSMIDNEAHFALRSGVLEIETKPHGHGDVHTLLYMTKYAERLYNQGYKYIVFFQDTNPLVFRALPAILGVSVKNNLEVNSLAIPRKVGEAVGAICNLVRQDGSGITVNVEYNQLDGLMKEFGGEKLDEKGYSVYPGNVNTLVFSLPEYTQVLNETQGLIAEFINPKYTDNTKTKFKSATRLECMMQDYPKLLKSCQRVGFTQIDRRFCFSACKNDLGTCATKFNQNLPPEGASTCEYDFYWLNAEILRICGVDVEQQSDNDAKSYSGITLNLTQKIFLHPNFGITLNEITSKCKNVKISSKSNVILAQDNIKLENVKIDGSVKILTSVKNKELNNKKYVTIQPIDTNNNNQTALPDWIKIRGYRAIGTENIQEIK